MKFIIPKNYKFTPKILGIIDYSTALLNAIWIFILYTFSNIFFTSISVKFYFIIILYLPLFIISIISFNNESFVYVVKYIFKYYKSPKLHLYKRY